MRSSAPEFWRIRLHQSAAALSTQVRGDALIGDWSDWGEFADCRDSGGHRPCIGCADHPNADKADVAIFRGLNGNFGTFCTIRIIGLTLTTARVTAVTRNGMFRSIR